MKAKHPKIHLDVKAKKSKLNLLNLILGNVITWSVILIFFSLPDQVPIHFDIDGTAIGYGGRGTLTTLGVVSLVQALVGLAVQDYPHNFSYLVRITDRNAERQYRLAIMFLKLLSLFVTLSIGWVVFSIAHVALTGCKGLTWYCAPVLLGAFVLGVVYYVWLSWKMR